MSNVIVVGCGRVGSQLANMLSDNGNNVCCIDRDIGSCTNRNSHIGSGKCRRVIDSVTNHGNFSFFL